MTAPDLMLLLLKGVLVAAIPLAGVWAARGQDRLRRLAWAATFLAFDLVVFGAFTRLTDSGLGCPDWPGCFAKANPLAARDAIASAALAAPYGPVSMSKAWIEMIHRFLAMGLGAVLIVMAVWSFIDRGRANRSPRLAAFLLLWVCLIGAFGYLTVRFKLQPVVVTAHLLLALALLAMLTWHALRFERAARVGAPVHPAAPPLRWLALLCAPVLAVQVALGGWTSTNYAVLACNGFPRCQGAWLPRMDFVDGFTWWRSLGLGADGGLLSLDALVAINWTHRAFAALLAALLLALAVACGRYRTLRPSAIALGALLAVQLCTGIVNVTFDWPLVAAVLHNAGAAGLVVALVVVNYRLHQPLDSPSSSAFSLPIAGRA